MTAAEVERHRPGNSAHAVRRSDRNHHHTVVDRLLDIIAHLRDVLASFLGGATPETVAVRDILLILREPPAKTFAACPGIRWLQNDAWRRSIDAALTDLADDTPDRISSAWDR